MLVARKAVLRASGLLARRPVESVHQRDKSLAVGEPRWAGRGVVAVPHAIGPGGEDRGRFEVSRGAEAKETRERVRVERSKSETSSVAT